MTITEKARVRRCIGDLTSLRNELRNLVLFMSEEQMRSERTKVDATLGRVAFELQNLATGARGRRTGHPR